MSQPTGPDIRPDLDPAEEFAEGVGVDPTQEEIEEYRRLAGDPAQPDGVLDADVAGSDPSVD